MQNYLITKGYLTFKYIDEITLEEKTVRQPIHMYDVCAENLECAKYICELMGSVDEEYRGNVEIFEEIPEEKASIDPEDWYPFYRLN